METATTPVPATMSLWDLCLQGGWSMIPLALLLLLCVYVFVERLVVLRAAGREDANFMNRIRGYIHEGEIESDSQSVPCHCHSRGTADRERHFPHRTPSERCPCGNREHRQPGSRRP